jgi:hypothetical protein
MIQAEGCACSTGSRKGIAATTIQSVIGSCPMRAAASVVAIVEKVLLISPSSAAARKFSQTSDDGFSRGEFKMTTSSATSCEAGASNYNGQK